MNIPVTPASKFHSDDAPSPVQSTDASQPDLASAYRLADVADVVGHADTGVRVDAMGGAGGTDDVQDATWVDQALEGDPKAFENLFLKHRQRVFAVAWRLLRDEDGALDVVQDAFVKAYEQLEKLRGPGLVGGRFFPWIRRIAINLSIDRLRHVKRGVEVSLDERRVGGGEEAHEERSGLMVARSHAEGPARRAELTEFNAAFSEAVKKLSDAHRTVFMLHAAEGLSYKEIAETLDCNMGTVMSRLFYARKRLQELLSPHL